MRLSRRSRSGSSLWAATNPQVNARTVKEFIAFAKANPGKLFYGSPGNGTPHHLAMELFKSATGIDVAHIPYKGTAGAVRIFSADGLA